MDDSIECLPYFHGHLSRLNAEKLLRKNGQFLLRHTVQLVNDNQQKLLVLSCKYGQEYLHFIIHQMLIGDDPKTNYYYFENDKTFLKVEDLINYYQINNKPITKDSGAIISEPIDRIDLDDQQQIVFRHLNLDTHVDNDQLMVDKVVKLIFEYDVKFLSKLLLKTNVKFMLNFAKDNDDDDHLKNICSSLELLLLPEGTRLRKNLIIRHECLKYFFIKIILKYTKLSINKNSIIKQINLIKKLIQIAAYSELDLNDHFSFGILMYALTFPSIQQSFIWKLFEQNQNDSTLKSFKNDLQKKFVNYLTNSKLSSNKSTTLPFMIKLCHLIECSFIIDTNLLTNMFDCEHVGDFNDTMLFDYDQQIGLNNFTIDDILSSTEACWNLIENLSNFNHNCNVYLQQQLQKSPKQIDTTLDQLFRTDFHVKFLFNTDKSPGEHHNGDYQLNSNDFYQLELNLNELI